MDYYLLRQIESLENEFIDRERDSKKLKKQLRAIKSFQKDIDAGIICLASVLNIAQGGVIKFIENIVGSALRLVYGKKYGFKLEYEIKRNQPEIYMSIIKGRAKLEPKFDCGIGIADVTAFALRLALWALYEPRTSNVLLFDEPFKNISGVKQLEDAAMMVKRLSEELGVQIIIVSSKIPLTEHADKVFEVTYKKGKSLVREL